MFPGFRLIFMLPGMLTKPRQISKQTFNSVIAKYVVRF